MPYALKIKRQARKALDLLPLHVRNKIDAELTKVTLRPRDNKKLRGFDDTFRIRAGDYRVIYEINDEEITVTVIKVGPRGDVYK